ncbi:cancer/testis antigen 55 [Oryctolagus cuniculus]|uniref:Cancer/testis antigen 55 n=1 Tax=Oryctolagus cuniculus TaxID=9986 RepID=G1T790_RABIT|nr:cancer/testis antigen 55 [Oryctolagus cuniculus]
MLRLLRRVMTFFRGKSQETAERQPIYLQDDSSLENQQILMESDSGDYSMMDESLCYSSDRTDSDSLISGQGGLANAEESELPEELKSFQVVDISGDIRGAGPSELETGILIDYVRVVKKRVVYLKEKIKFSLDIVSEGFVPYKGDWLEVEYSLQPGTSNIKAHSAKPVNCKHVEQVCISNVRGKKGVIAKSFFFTLDSLIRPDGYVPRNHDAVNVDVVESSQGCFKWRAYSITPI